MHSIRRKVYVAFLALLFVVSFTLPQQKTNAAAFDDLLEDNPYRTAIEYLKEEGVIKGYANGDFKPDTTINRAELARIVNATLFPDYSPKTKNCFKDVNENQLHSKDVCTLKEKGLISGYSDGNFKPEQNINMAEVSKIISLAFLANKVATQSKGAPWHKNFIEALGSSNAIPVSVDTVEHKVTRGEVTEMIWRLKAKKEDKPSKSFEALTTAV